MKSLHTILPIVLTSAFFLFAGNVKAQTTAHNCHSLKNALTVPISVMGNHIHTKGSGMVSLTGKFMSMNDNIQGKDPISSEGIFSTYQVAPESMNMQMYMLGFMYGLTDKFTLSAMGMYHLMDMQSITRMQMNHVHNIAGLGDVKLSAIWGIRPETQIRLGVNIPIGKFNLRPENDSGNSNHHMGISYYPYCMQLGSGTPDILAGINQNWSSGKFAGGFQANGTIRVRNNNMGYRLGNSFDVQSWMGIPVANRVGIHAKVSYFTTGKVKGQIEDINPDFSPQSDPLNYERHIVNLSLGVKFKPFKKMTVGIEAGTPVFQYSSGIWMRENYFIQAGLTQPF